MLKGPPPNSRQEDEGPGDAGSAGNGWQEIRKAYPGPKLTILILVIALAAQLIWLFWR